MYGIVLTEWEYDNLLTDVERSELAAVIRQPTYEQKTSDFRRMYGHYYNGDISDPVVRSVTGYGSPRRPSIPNLLPVIPVYATG